MSAETIQALVAARSDVHARDWRGAIRAAADPLLMAGAVSRNYVDRCIGMVEEQGAYIVVAPGVALAHARPEDGARSLALSFARLDPPLRFGHPDNDPVELLFVFAAPRGDRHVAVLGRLARALMGDLGDRLRSAQTDAEASRVLEETILDESNR